MYSVSNEDRTIGAHIARAERPENRETRRERNGKRKRREEKKKHQKRTH